MLWYCNYNFIQPDIEYVRLDTLISENRFKTGDLILFRYNYTYFAPLVFSYYGHIGIVYVPDKLENSNLSDITESESINKKNKIPYILEAIIPSEKVTNYYNKNGIYCSPLIERIRNYKGKCMYKELYNHVNNDTNKEFSKFIKYCLNNMEYESNIYYNSIKKGIMGEPINNKINCGELTFLCLIKLKLLNKNEYKKKIFHYLKWMCNIKYLENYNYYNKTIRIS